MNWTAQSSKPIRPKAVALLSGGLDSILAIRLMQEQNIEIYALTLLLIAGGNSQRHPAVAAAKRLGVPHKLLDATEEFIDILKHPRYGYGSNMNPCIDCRIFELKKAAEYMREIGAQFIVTGEVLGERPMSQRREPMRLVVQEAGLEGLVLRPLSAKLLEPTIPEKEGWVDRERLLAIRGRSRKPQMALAARYRIEEYPSPAGGCLLTDPGFAERVRDLMRHEPNFDRHDLALLKFGRLFRLSPEAKIFVGRDEADCQALAKMARPEDILIEMAEIPGPLALARGKLTQEQISLACAITARYSKARGQSSAKLSVRRGPSGSLEIVTVQPAKEEEFLGLRIGVP